MEKHSELRALLGDKLGPHIQWEIEDYGFTLGLGNHENGAVLSIWGALDGKGKPSAKLVADIDAAISAVKAEGPYIQSALHLTMKEGADYATADDPPRWEHTIQYGSRRITSLSPNKEITQDERFALIDMMNESLAERPYVPKPTMREAS